MSTLKILMIGADLSSNGGIASVVKCYYREWQKNRNEIEIIFLKTSYYKDKKAAYEFFMFFNSLLKALFILTTKKISIVHIHTSSGFSFLRKSFFVIISKIYLKKVIFHIHASTFYNFFLNKNSLLKFYIHKILKISDLIITLCHDWEVKLKTKYSNINVITLYNPIVIRQRAHRKDYEQANSLKILFMGFLIPSKGIFDILKIAKKLYDINVNNIKFIIAGKGELEKALIKFINANSLNEIVKYVGWVADQKKYDLLESADIFLLPSYNEGMPISILEAMSYSMPIISTRIAGIPDLVNNGKNGFLCNPGQVDEISKIILFLNNNKSLLNAMAKNSYERSKFFASDIIFHKLKAIYDKMINQ